MRLFVESVLRYGLPPRFQARALPALVLLLPMRGQHVWLQCASSTTHRLLYALSPVCRAHTPTPRAPRRALMRPSPEYMAKLHKLAS